MAADPVFIDTNVLVAASVAAHPSHGVASAYLARLEVDGAPVCINADFVRFEDEIAVEALVS
jgi:predicted nucleic acid-binding protein